MTASPLHIGFTGKAQGAFYQPGPAQVAGNELTGQGDTVHQGAQVLSLGAEALQVLQHMARQGFAVPV